MADISKITLPSGSEYNIKDATARADIETLRGSVTGAMHYLGVTTTAITDGSATNPVSVGGTSVTAKSGDVVINGDKEFVFSDTDNKWHEYGSTGSLKALAFKDTASGEYTPAGTVSQPTFTGTEADVTIASTANANGNYTPSGTVSKPTFTGGEFTSSGSFTPEGEVTFTNSNKTATVSKASSGTVTYTPEGTVTPTVTLSNTTVNSITDVGTLPSCTLPNLTTTVVNENLTLGWTAGTFAAGTLPTKGSDVSVATGVESATATFSGTGVRLVTGNISVPSSASFSGTSGTVNVTGTPTGEVSQPTFTGTKVLITGKTTATGTVSQPTFTGTKDTITVS